MGKDKASGALVYLHLHLEDIADKLAGANTLLAYFHYCNKGIYPFSDECRDQDLQTLAALDDWTIQFVHDTRKYAAEHSKWNYSLWPQPNEPDLSETNEAFPERQWEVMWETDDYENGYYYVSQLFEVNWQPRVMA